MEDTVEYRVFPPDGRSDLASFCADCLTALKDDLLGYIWHCDPFNLAPAGDHLLGRIHFGDNIDDEWFVVSLLLRLTERVDAVVRVVDGDGEVLLIEAADVLPAWAQEPELADGRVFLFGGKVHLIPIASRPTELTPLPGTGTPATRDAVAVVRRFPDVTLASESVQSAIASRVKQSQNLFHHANVIAPASVLAVLDRRPDLIAPAVQCFYSRDAIDTKRCREMSTFAPKDLVRGRVRFTKCLYAMLETQRFQPDRRAGWTIPDDESSAEVMRGVKVASGFEILASQGRRNRVTQVDGKRFRVFKEKLEKNGYFKGLLEGSKDYKALEEQAKQYFMAAVDVDEDSPRFSDQLLQVLEDLEVDVADLRERSVPPPDDDSWLDLNADSFDEMLRRQFRVSADSTGVDSTGVDQTGTDPTASVPDQLKRFLRKVSGLEGVEVEDSFDLDVDEFERAMRSMLDVAMGKEEIEEEEEEVDLDREMEADPEMQAVLEQMGDELAGTNVEDMDRPLDVDATVLKNLLEAYNGQEGMPGPASTLLEPLGVRLEKSE